jgi:DDE superfamily endonuclease
MGRTSTAGQKLSMTTMSALLLVTVSFPCLARSAVDTDLRTEPTKTRVTCIFVASACTATGTVVADCYRQRTGAEFLAVLRKAVRPHAGKEIHVVLDNLSTHDTPDVQAWLERNPSVTFHFTTVGSSWINEIELARHHHKQAIRGGTFASVNALIARIRAYVEHWTPAPRRSSGPPPPTRSSPRSAWSRPTSRNLSRASRSNANGITGY